MSVLIRGMEMPDSEEKCKFFQPAPFRLPYCAINGVCNGIKDCPLVPVPPHGDLIDRDKLEKDIDKYIGGEESRSRFHHWVQVQSVVIPGNKGEQT